MWRSVFMSGRHRSGRQQNGTGADGHCFGELDYVVRDLPEPTHSPVDNRKLKQILAALRAAQTIDGMRVPTFGLHALKDDLKGFWAVTVRANWRVIFRFEDGQAREVDLVDYH